MAVPQFSNNDDNNGNKSLKDSNWHPAVVTASVHEVNVCEIPRSGGVCAVPGAMIVVPSGVLSKTTYFQIKLDVGPNVVVSLAASSKECKKNKCSDDIGSKGFNKPLTLVVAKFGAQSTSGAGLTLGSPSPSGNSTVVTRDLGAFLSAEVSHFSEFVILD